MIRWSRMSSSARAVWIPYAATWKREALGDEAAVLQFELRGPSLGRFIGAPIENKRIMAVPVQRHRGPPPSIQPLPQVSAERAYTLSLVGFGVRGRVAGIISGAELEERLRHGRWSTTTKHGCRMFVLFRVLGDF